MEKPLVLEQPFTISLKRNMYSQNNNNSMAPPQKPETFMLSSEAQQSLPHDAQVALNQVDNRMSCYRPPSLRKRHDGSQVLTADAVKYFLISAPVDWTSDSCIRRFLLPTGEYVSCVLW